MLLRLYHWIISMESGLYQSYYWTSVYWLLGSDRDKLLIFN